MNHNIDVEAVQKLFQEQVQKATFNAARQEDLDRWVSPIA